MGIVRRRSRVFVGASTLLVLAAIAAGGWVLSSGLSRFAERSADDSARSAVDLLANVGPRLPRLTRTTISRSLSQQTAGEIDKAVRAARHDDILAGLQIWDARGIVVYSGERSTQGTRPPMQPGVRAALAGAVTTERHPHEIDRTTGRRTGVLHAFEPLRDSRGKIFGAVEISQPLRPIEARAEGMQRRLSLLLGGGVLVLWLLALPMVTRAARSQAEQWVPHRREVAKQLRAALARDEIEMVYQPQIDPATGAVRAVEALVRWRQNGTLRTPDTFLPFVEATPVMAELTDRILDLSLAELLRMDAAGHALRMSVNCSASDLADATLPHRVGAALCRAGVAGNRLTLEVTETAIVADTEQAHGILTEIRRLGVDIAIDDFGTGHATIERLYQLPVDEIKIDRSFIGSDDRSRLYVAAIVRFAQALRLRVVAEGVEDEATHTFIAGLDGDLLQGYLISRPLTGPDLAAWLDARGAGDTLPTIPVERINA